MHVPRLFAARPLTLAACASLLAACGCQRSTPTPPSLPSGAGRAAPAPLIDLPVSRSTTDTNAVVTVDGATLTRGELNGLVDRELGAQGMAGAGAEAEPVRRQMERQTVDRFVMQSVLDQEAGRRGIAVTDADVDGAVEEVRKQIPQGTTLAQALKGAGIAEKDFRTDLARDLRIRKVVDAATAAGGAASDQAVRDFYTNNPAYFNQPEKVHARHILIASAAAEDNEAARKEKKARAESIRKELAEGGDFAALAKKHSDCPSKEQGGDLGAFERGQMVKEFEEAAFTQKTNEVSQVVETQFGYHIIQVTEHQPARTQSLDEVKGKIADFLGNQSRQQAVTQLVAELRAKAKITYADGMNPEPPPAPPAIENAPAPDAPPAP